ncbi:MFS transporter [Rouxiella badensis]|uniref:MFS transporter n=1 Tax=Rouxiella badensis TaxID=1646377 RepID=UPI001D13A457|nr:MFS transporter [Rouxiella badensis]MCC3721496.1 MFS transporter [Rouxiella badensis]MCC3731054.1 MFS transporter [Rouxiella badensis]MCC3735892.1 MFS transporter [Rouxiella badensis]MCC3742670.1 MFS transporter [Rouxiella badensis]MCC3761293.1 MFS transporter [Rouxiella badensis]
MRRYPRIRWMMIVFCFFAIAINYIDRVNLAIAAPHIKKDLGLDDATMGLILGAFFWTYALMQIPAGRLLDRLGARTGLAVAVGWWSLFTVFTAFGKGFTSIFISRLLLGIGEAGGNPGSAKVISNWFPKKQRGTASGIFDAGPRAGTAIALPLVAWLISVWDWETSFVVTGAIGLVWVVLWLVFYREPEDMKGIDEQERQNLLEDRGQSQLVGTEKIKLRTLFGYRNIWGMMIGFFCMNFATYFFVTWFPTYLTMSQGFSLKELGTLGAIPALMGIPGSLIGGYTSDWLYRKGLSLTAARKTCLIAGMLLSSVIALAAFTNNITIILTLFSLTYAGLAFTAANIWTLPADVAPSPNYVATIGGIQSFAGNLAGIVTASFTGIMVGLSNGSFVIPLCVAGGICLLGALNFMFVLGKIEPLNTPKNESGSDETTSPQQASFS